MRVRSRLLKGCSWQMRQQVLDLAADAVLSEPVSGLKSPITGKPWEQGKSVRQRKGRMGDLFPREK